MIKVIGKEHCGACMMTKNVLGAKGIEFEYSLLEDTLVILDETELVELSDDDKDLIPPPTTKKAPTPINIYLVFFFFFYIFSQSLNS